MTENNKYRIMENKLGFFVQKRVKRVEGSLWWKKTTNEFECVYDFRESINHGFNFIKKPFKTLDEAREYINDKTKYPIYHSVNALLDINRELHEAIERRDEAILKHSQPKQSTGAHQPTHDSTTTPPKRNKTMKNTEIIKAIEVLNQTIELNKSNHQVFSMSDKGAVLNDDIRNNVTLNARMLINEYTKVLLLSEDKEIKTESFTDADITDIIISIRTRINNLNQMTPKDAAMSLRFWGVIHKVESLLKK